MAFKRFGGKRKRDPEEDRLRRQAAWVPKTEAGKMVQQGLIGSMDQLHDKGLPILEPEIIDALLPEIESRPLHFNRTTRVRDSGRVFQQQVLVIVGNRNGWVGYGLGKAKNARAAVEKAEREAKLNLVRVPRGCGSWECACDTNHSLPVKFEGKNGSVRVTLMPAPRGVGLVAGQTAKQILELAGIKDVWLQTRGDTRTIGNFAKAVINAIESGNKKKSLFSRKFEAPKARIIEAPVEAIQQELQKTV